MMGPLDNLRQRLAPPIPDAIRDDFTILRAKRVETQAPVMYLMLLAAAPTAAWAGGADVHVRSNTACPRCWRCFACSG